MVSHASYKFLKSKDLNPLGSVFAPYSKSHTIFNKQTSDGDKLIESPEPEEVEAELYSDDVAQYKCSQDAFSKPVMQ